MSLNEVQPHPVFAQRLVAIAEELERAGQPGLAAELYEMAASLTAKGEAWRQRAAALRRASGGDEDPQREHKRHNLEASHAVGMARILEARGELARAQEMFDLAKLRAPFHYLAYAGAGYLHLRRRDLRAALEEFVQARRLNPLDRKLAVEAARIALELEDYPEALRHATDALLVEPGPRRGRGRRPPAGGSTRWPRSAACPTTSSPSCTGSAPPPSSAPASRSPSPGPASSRA